MNLLIVAIFVIIIVTILWSTTPNPTRVTESFTIIKCTDKHIINRLKKLLSIVDMYATDADITWYTDSGTILGIMRHGDIIPWDDDCDICVLEGDKEEFLNLRYKFESWGVLMTEFWGGYRLFFEDGQEINHQNRNWTWSNNVKEDFSYKYPFVDVFFVDLIDGLYQYTNERVRKIYSKFYYKPNELFPLKRRMLGNFYVNTPNDPTNFLNRAYGNDWRTVGYQEYDHQNMQFLSKVKFDIRDAICDNKKIDKQIVNNKWYP